MIVELGIGIFRFFHPFILFYAIFLVMLICHKNSRKSSGIPFGIFVPDKRVFVTKYKKKLNKFSLNGSKNAIKSIKSQKSIDNHILHRN